MHVHTWVWPLVLCSGKRDIFFADMPISIVVPISHARRCVDDVFAFVFFASLVVFSCVFSCVSVFSSSLDVDAVFCNHAFYVWSFLSIYFCNGIIAILSWRTICGFYLLYACTIVFCRLVGNATAYTKIGCFSVVCAHRSIFALFWMKIYRVYVCRWKKNGRKGEGFKRKSNGFLSCNWMFSDLI